MRGLLRVRVLPASNLVEKTMTSLKRFVVIAGCQRSGTTLTGQILGAHSSAVLIDEADGLYDWFHAKVDDTVEVARLYRDMITRSIDKYKNPTDRYTDDGELASHIDTLVLKAPNLTYFGSGVARLGVPAYVVYPVRDPRAVVQSMLRLSHIPFVDNQLRLLQRAPAVRERQPQEYAQLADVDQDMAVRMTAMWKIKSGLAPSFEACGLPVHQFRYEDLVDQTEKEVKRIISFCGMPWSGGTLQHEKVYQGHGPGGTERKRAVDKASLTDWRRRSDGAFTSAILRSAQPLAERFGYVEEAS